MQTVISCAKSVAKLLLRRNGGVAEGRVVGIVTPAIWLLEFISH
jgi:hypothetical protein